MVAEKIIYNVALLFIMMLPGIISGKIQEWLGYENFFIWVMACTLATFLVSAIIKIDPKFGKK